MAAASTAFIELRASGAPWAMIVTPDPDATIEALAAVAVPGLDAPLTVGWNLAAGHRLLGDETRKRQEALVAALGAPNATANKPFPLLQSAAKLPPGSVLFMTVPGAAFWQSDICVSAVANLRAPFKETSRCLVFVAMPGAGDKLPPQLEADVPLLRVPLPTIEELTALVTEMTGSNGIAVSDGDVTVAARSLRGMTLFAAENAVARKCLTGTLDASSLAAVRIENIESSTGGGLTFERGGLTFDDVGGLLAFKDFGRRLFVGPEAPDLVVRADEIDKTIGANATGAVADNTGISQSLLRSLLTNIEDNNYLFGLLAGCPGSGKSLSTVALGSTFGRTTLAVNFDRCKGSLVGQSEAAIQRVFDVIAALGGRRVLILATCNRLDTLPPELLSRAGGAGIWFFDSPSAEQRRRIWAIQLAAHGIAPGVDLPDDAGYVGRDIRNVCRLAKMLACSPAEASVYVVKTGAASAELIDTSRMEAEMRGFLDAETPGPFKRSGVADDELRKVAGAGPKRVIRIVPVGEGGDA